MQISRDQEKGYDFFCATLNFSGININPFEYYDGSTELERISQIMSTIMKKQVSKYSSKELSIIDTKYKKSKISVRLGHEMLIDGKLPSKTQYIQMWIDQYRLTKSKSIKGDTDKIIEDMAMFEYYCYITLVAYVYERKFDENYEIADIKGLDPTDLIKKLEEYFKRPNTSLEKKSEIVCDFINEQDVDIMFIQEGAAFKHNKIDLNVYEIKKKNEQAIIIYKKELFDGPIKELNDKYEEAFFFNEDTVIEFLRKGEDKYLLMCAHLTSKDHKVKQALEMLKALNLFKDKNPDIKTIIGIDANHCLFRHRENFYYTVPKSQEKATSVKKRTSMQVQFHKTDVSVNQIKDHIMSSIPIKTPKVIHRESPSSSQSNKILEKETEKTIFTMDGSDDTQKTFLPNPTHPYDHFVVVGLI